MSPSKYDYQIDEMREYIDVQFEEGLVILEDRMNNITLVNDNTKLSSLSINKLVLPRTFREFLGGAFKSLKPNHIVLPIETRINVEEWANFFKTIDNDKYGKTAEGIDPNARSITFTYLNEQDIMAKLTSLMKSAETYGNKAAISEHLTIAFDGPLMEEEVQREITSFLKTHGINKVVFKKQKVTVTNRNMIKEVLDKITYASADIREAVLGEIDEIINNYYTNMQHQRPNISFASQINLKDENLTPAELTLNNDLIKLVHRVNRELDELKKIALYRKYLFRENEVSLQTMSPGYQNVAQYINNIKLFAVSKYGYGEKYNIIANYINQLLIPYEEKAEDYIKNGTTKISLDFISPQKELLEGLKEYYNLVMNDILLEEKLDKDKLIDFNQQYSASAEFEHNLIDKIDEKIHDLILELSFDDKDMDYRLKIREVLDSIDKIEEKDDLINVINCLKLIDNDLENDLTVEESPETLTIQEIINIINANELSAKEKEQIYSYIGQILENSINGVEMDLLAELENAKYITRSYITEKQKFIEQTKEFEQNYNHEVEDEYHVENGNDLMQLHDERSVIEQHNNGGYIRRR